MDKVLSILEIKGPLTGKDFVLETGMSILSSWMLCSGSEKIITRIIGKRYLRLDQKVEGYARLSPSIMREFLNYTIIGLEADKPAIDARACQLEKELAEISKKKIGLARDTIARLVENHQDRDVIKDKVCFIIAGDVVFGMAHTEPRPESSTGELVKGSDLDIITIADGLSDQLLKSLDTFLYKEKYNLLMNPVSKEEIDYIIKDLETVREQLQFKNFKAMVASKILEEGEYLYGSHNLFAQIKKMIAQVCIPERIRLLEEKAHLNRVSAERSLLSAADTEDHDQLMALFYTTEEKEEIF